MCLFEDNFQSFTNISYNSGISNMFSFDRINMFNVLVHTFVLYSLYAHNFEITIVWNQNSKLKFTPTSFLHSLCVATRIPLS